MAWNHKWKVTEPRANPRFDPCSQRQRSVALQELTLKSGCLISSKHIQRAAGNVYGAISTSRESLLGVCLSPAVTDAVRSWILSSAFCKVGLSAVGWCLACQRTITFSTTKGFLVSVLPQNISYHSELMLGTWKLKPLLVFLMAMWLLLLFWMKS